MRTQMLVNWQLVPAARLAHPQEDHLLPHMVVAGAAGADQVSRVFVEHVMRACVSRLRRSSTTASALAGSMARGEFAGAKWRQPVRWGPAPGRGPAGGSAHADSTRQRKSGILMDVHLVAFLECSGGVVTPSLSNSTQMNTHNLLGLHNERPRVPPHTYSTRTLAVAASVIGLPAVMLSSSSSLIL